MPNALGVLRHLVPAPTLNTVTFRRRGFPVEPNPVTRRVEGVPLAVVQGFQYGADYSDPAHLAQLLDGIDPLYRSLAYEGAIGALVLRDIMAGGRSHRARDFVRGPAAPHSMLAYIGCGLVLARLPRRLWERAIPVFDADPLLPWMRWVAIDGYAFDKAYFNPKRWAFGHQLPRPYPLEGAPEYFQAVFDQGIGRAIWFIFGGNTEPIPDVIQGFPQHRRADLWSGIGATAAYIGGPSRSRLQALAAAAAGYRADMAVGAVSAIKARHHAGYVPETTDLAADVICGGSVAEAVALAEAATPAGPEAATPAGPDAPAPAYIQWRSRIRAEFIGLTAQRWR